MASAATARGAAAPRRSEARAGPGARGTSPLRDHRRLARWLPVRGRRRRLAELTARKPWHHRAERPADPLDLRVLLLRPRREPLGCARARLPDPPLGEAAVLSPGE